MTDTNHRTALRRILAVAAAFSALFLTVSFSPADPAGAGSQTIVVDINTDANLTACTAAAADCTLRGALNIVTPNDTIAFNMPPNGTGCIFNACGINVLTELPVIDDAGVTIDGYTQPNSVVNTAAPGEPTNSAPKVILVGIGCAGCTGLSVQADDVTIRGLIIDTFPGRGIHITADDAVVEGNWIGVALLGSAAGNGTGVRIDGGEGNLIGGTSNAARNVISANGTGIGVFGSEGDPATGNDIQGNLVGLHPSGNGNVPLGNSLRGIVLSGADGNLIGGNTPGARNTVSGQDDATGIALIGGAADNVISGNYVGTDITGTAAVPNSVGVVLSAAGAGNLVGGDTAGERNIISGNSAEGVILASTSGAQVVSGNYIGTNPAGTAAVPNGGNGVLIETAIALPPTSQVTVGGKSPGERNVISGNGGSGVSVIEGSFDNIIAGNHIGTNAAGSAALPNAGRGVYIEDSHDNVIGDRFSTSARNVISGNTGNGVQIYMGSGNLIGNNHIGTNASILAAIPNGFHGITLEDASGTEVLSNTISGNQFSGIFVTTGQANVILGNLIGTDGKGDAAIPNRQDGITVDSDDNVIGSTGVDGPNIISGNIRHGVVLASGEGNEVAGNVIGLDRFDGPLGNGGSGIAIDFANDTLVSENTIAHNGFVQKESTGGVLVAVGDANRITGNSIHSNAELGIDVFHQGDGAGGISPNDPGDTDTGGNNAQNFPVLDSAEGGSLTVEGSLNSLPFVSYRIEFFISSECDVSGNGEGEVYLGGAEIELDGDGFTTFTANSPASVEPGDFVTATATNLETNDTSEFSNCVEIEPAPATPTPVATDTPPPTPTAIPTATAAPTGTTATATPTATPTPTPAPSGKGKLTQGDVDCDGDVDSADALKVLRHVAALSVSQEPGCPQIGSAGLLFADADCDGDVDSVDALKVLRHVAALPVTQSEPCADIGSPL